MSEDGAGRDRSGSRFVSRRQLLALAGAGVTTTLAGCGGGSSSTDTPPETTGPPANGGATATPTATATTGGTPTGSTPTDDDGNTGNGDGQVEDTVPEGGSYFAPGDGFADPAPWLEEEDPEVYVVSEPTREALGEAVVQSGPRVVVFETSGTIDLQGHRLEVGGDELFIAGQTAPSPGITLTRGYLRIEANDCVVQHLRVRPGTAGKEGNWQPDTIRTGDGTRNNVVDHCTATWSIDENMTPGYDSRNTTFSNCLIAEPLNDSIHAKGPHGYGLLVGDGAEGVALLGNVHAHNVSRNPRLKAETESVLVNNVIYHFEEAVNLDESTVSSVVGNAFMRPTESTGVVEGGGVYHSDNLLDGDATLIANLESYSGPPVWPGSLEAMPSDDVVQHGLRYAGARPADRTENDRRVLDQVRNGEGSYVDNQNDVGGYPDLAENTRSLDVPDSGLRNWLRHWAVAVEEPDVSPP